MSLIFIGLHESEIFNCKIKFHIKSERLYTLLHDKEVKKIKGLDFFTLQIKYYYLEIKTVLNFKPCLLS